MNAVIQDFMLCCTTEFNGLTTICKLKFPPVPNWDRGSTAVKVLCYKSEGRWFDPSWCHWIFH